uniref:ABC transporter substrate-binding protein n=1 Tax=Sinomonas sp. G460-2 TaxID=3393464 RepID=UPI0039F03CF7
MRKKFITAAAATAAALVLAGCSSGADATGGDGKTTLTVVGFEGGGTELADIPQINADFQKKYPDIKIEYKYVANGEYDQYNNTRLAAGTAADVLMTNPTRVQQWQKQGYLADLSDQAWATQLLPNVAPFGQIDGKTYAFTQQNIPIGLYANLDILKKAGITTVPQTWPDFLTALQKLKTAGQPGLLLANQGGWTSEQLTLALAANLLPSSWGAGYDTGQSSWNPTYSPVFDHIKELLTSGTVDGKLMNGIEPFNTGNADFTSGKWAFTVMGAWELQNFEKNAKFDFSFNPFPGGDAGSQPNGVTFVGSGWGVNAASSHKDAAEKYVAFMADPANDSRYLAAENSFTTLRSVPSPTMTKATAYVDAFNAGHSQVSPIEYLHYPTYEQQFWKVGTSLFNDPSQSTSTLLTQLD